MADLKPASFRGAQFHVTKSDREVGRRNVIHEFPGRDTVAAEDLGRLPRRFPVEAIVIGPDYQADLAKLELALEEEGPGTLLHPYRGELNVVVDGPVRISESTAEGGMARVSITFVEEGEEQFPGIEVDSLGLTVAAVNFTIDRMKLDDVDLAGPDFLTSAMRTLLTGPKGLTNLLSKVNNQITAKFGLIDDVSGAIDDLSTEVNGLLAAPATLATKVKDVINSVLTAVSSAGAIVNLYTPKRGDEGRPVAGAAAALSATNQLVKYGDAFPEVPGDTESRAKERRNQELLVDLVEVVGLAEGARLLAEMELDTAENATDVFDALAALFDRIQARGTIDGATDKALRDLRMRLAQRFKRRVTDLVGLGRYTPGITVPALDLAWRLYGDAERAEEIWQRNGVEHPGFLPGGVELAVADA